MRFLLVNPAELQSLTVWPPIHLWSMRSNLPSHSVETWDDSIQGSLLMAYTYKTYQASHDIFGASIRFSSQHDTMLSYTYIGKGLADQTHLGGAHAAFATDIQWAKGQPPTGICTDGWGENYLRRLVSLPNLSFDDLSPPHPSPIEIESYWFTAKPHDKTLTQRWVPVEFSRGCLRKCSFCSSKAMFSGRHTHSFDWIRSYLTWLKESLGVQEVLIEDDSLDLDGWAYPVVELLNSLSLKWSTPNGLPARPLLHLSQKQLKEVARNCWRLSLPFETGCPSTAKAMNLGNKWLPWEEAYELTLRLREAGIQAAGFFIIGYPGEAEDSIRTTLAYANSLPLTDRYIYCATPYPGTALYDLCLEHNYLDLAPGPSLYYSLSYRKSVISTPILLSSQVEAWRVLDQTLHNRRKQHA